MSVNIYGFTLLRNGIKYDYCFEEALRSMDGVCQSVYLALGASEDGTEDAVSKLNFIKSTPTVWDDNLKEGAIILSEQTNIALDSLRKDHGADDKAWGIYLQCDEVFHEEDYELIKEDIRKAQEQGYEGISFRYLHFWQTHHHIAINKKWYPQEIRGVKLSSKAKSWGDAQSFKNISKIYQSEARVFHYGHVREEECYKNKKADILTLYHEDDKLAKYKKREKKFDDLTETLLFFGNHPKIMKERIERLGDIWTLDKAEKVFIVGNEKDFSDTLISKINAEKVNWLNSISDVPKEHKNGAVIVKESFLSKLFHKSKVPTQMRSKLALPWSEDFRLMLKLSEKKIGLKS